MALSLKFSAGVITGSNINCGFRLGQSVTLRPGAYTLHSPQKDPIYGVVVLMTPGAAAPGAASVSSLTGKRIHYANSPTTVAANVTLPSGSSAANYKINEGRPGASQDATYVLSDKAIAGRNSIVVTHGFSDLISALQANGVIEVAVS